MPTPDPTPERADRRDAGDAAFDALPHDPALDAHLARLLRDAPRCAAPDGFTDRVMAALPPRPGTPPPEPTAPPRPVQRPAVARAAARGRATLRRLRSASIVTFILVVAVIGASRLALPDLYADVPLPVAPTAPVEEAEVTRAEVAVARAQVELALSILGTAHRKAESDAERLLAP